MCGIAGIVEFGPYGLVDKSLAMMDSCMKHRGPDGNDRFIDKNIGLAHRRLSIIDTSEKSSQPMTSHNNRYVLVYNGAIYNYKELRNELTKLGVNFKSKGDTEVLLNGLIEWGTDLIPRLNGMFAFAFYDSWEQKMILARDRYGIKPLYFLVHDKAFIFASEEKSICNVNLYKKNIDLLALSEYLTFQNVFSNRTFFANIQILSPGFFAEISTSSKFHHIEQQKYWDFCFEFDHLSKNPQDEMEEVERLLEQAVERTLLSDVPVGQYLSSGIDTTLIASIATQNYENFPTFTVGFNQDHIFGIENNFDEREGARFVSKYLGTSQHEYEIQALDMQVCLNELNRALDTPRVGQSYPNFYAAKMASNSAKVMLSGTGSDEIFGGYPWRYRGYEPAKNRNDFASEYYNSWQRLLSDQEKSEILAPVWKNIQNYNTKDVFCEIVLKHQGSTKDDYSNFQDSLYLEAKTFLPGLLNIEDKIHMHFSIENRVPFLDNDLVDFAMKCNPALKVKLNLLDGKKVDENLPIDKKKLNSPSGKLILQNIYKRRFPNFDGWKTKKGFSGPDASWFKGESSTFIKNVLLNKKAPIFEILDYASVTKHIESHFSGQKNKRLLIWSLLSINEWCRNNI